MQIQSSNLLLSAQHQTTERTEVKASLNFWSGDAGQPPASASSVVLDQVTLSTQSQQLAASQKTRSVGAAADAGSDPQRQMLTDLVQRITGQNADISSAHDVPAAPAQARPSGAAYGLAYDYHETNYQSEQSTFSAQGVIKTADGKEIHFSLNLEMSHESLEQTDVSVRASGATRHVRDPLVVNFGGHSSQLGDTRFAFDVHGKGGGFPRSGSGFLALDKNGFSAANDSIFSQLKLLLKDGQGLDVLASLADKGIGALHRGNAAAPANQVAAADGQTKSSGMSVNDGGSAGSKPKVDLAV